MYRRHQWKSFTLVHALVPRMLLSYTVAHLSLCWIQVIGPKITGSPEDMLFLLGLSGHGHECRHSCQQRQHVQMHGLSYMSRVSSSPHASYNRIIKACTTGSQSDTGRLEFENHKVYLMRKAQLSVTTPASARTLMTFALMLLCIISELCISFTSFYCYTSIIAQLSCFLSIKIIIISTNHVCSIRPPDSMLVQPISLGQTRIAVARRSAMCKDSRLGRQRTSYQIRD